MAEIYFGEPIVVAEYRGKEQNIALITEAVAFKDHALFDIDELAPQVVKESGHLVSLRTESGDSLHEISVWRRGWLTRLFKGTYEERLQKAIADARKHVGVLALEEVSVPTT